METVFGPLNVVFAFLFFVNLILYLLYKYKDDDADSARECLLWAILSLILYQL